VARSAGAECNPATTRPTRVQVFQPRAHEAGLREVAALEESEPQSGGHERSALERRSSLELAELRRRPRRPPLSCIASVAAMLTSRMPAYGTAPRDPGDARDGEVGRDHGIAERCSRNSPESHCHATGGSGVVAGVCGILAPSGSLRESPEIPEFRDRCHGSLPLGEVLGGVRNDGKECTSGWALGPRTTSPR
jgi:hypothetical protein